MGVSFIFKGNETFCNLAMGDVFYCDSGDIFMKTNPAKRPDGSIMYNAVHLQSGHFGFFTRDDPVCKLKCDIVIGLYTTPN